MFDLDFQKIHRYLFPVELDEVSGLPRSGNGRPRIPILNSDNPRSGIHICRETIFTSGSLALICYARNTIDQGHPNGVKLCLKLTAGIKKGRGSYGSTRVQGETISFECDLHDALNIWRVLRGQQNHYSRYLPLPGAVPKSFSIKYQEGASDPFYAQFEESGVSIRVPFNEGASLSFQAVIVALARVLYPHLDSSGVIQLLDDVSPQSHQVSHYQRDQLTEGETSTPASGNTEELVLWEEGDEEITPGLRKTIYAICLQTWPTGRKDVAQYIQRHASRRIAQRIVDAANSGDFSMLDTVARQVDQS